jgi:putative MATE family efflux protein
MSNAPGHWDNKAILRLLWPLIIEQLLAVTMGAADTIMVSGVGEFAVTGVNIVDNINNLLIIAFVALCTGGTVVVSQYIGRGDLKSANVAARQLVYVVTLISIVIGLAIGFFRRPVIRFLYGAIDPDVMDAAATYFLITAASYPFLAIYNANAALFRAEGNSQVTMRIALLVNAINVGGNAALIYGAKIGVTGAAISTLTSRVVAAIVTLSLMTHVSPKIRKKAKNPEEQLVTLRGISRIALAPHMIRSILNVGIPSGLENSMFQIGRLATQRIFAVFGIAAMAGNAIASVINSFTFMPGMAFAMTMLTIVGQCVGANDYGEAKQHVKKLMTWCYCVLGAICIAVLIFVDPIISIFNLSPQAHDFARIYLRIHCITMGLFWPCSFALPNALRAAGDNRYVMIAATITMWTVRVGGSYLLSYALGFGSIGVWLAMGADFVARSIFYVTRWIGGKWQTKNVIDR